MAGVLSRPSPVALARAGASRVWRRGRGAVAAVWAIVALLSIAAVLPAWSWWAGELSHAIDARHMLATLDIGVVSQLDDDNPAGFGTIAAAAIGAALIALFLNPFLAGGLLGRLSREAAGDEAPGPGFAADGLRHYGPLFRLLLLTIVVASCVGAVVVLLPAAIAAGVGLPDAAVLGVSLAAAIAVVGAATIVLDLARIRVVRGGTRRPLQALGWALAFGLRRLARLAGLALIAGTLVAAAGAALVAGQSWLAGGGWAAIAAGLALQQGHALGRTWIRATWIAGELALVEAEGGDDVRSAAPGEERRQVPVVVEGEAGERRQAADERPGGGDLPPEIPGGRSAEGDAGRQRPQPPPLA